MAVDMEDLKREVECLYRDRDTGAGVLMDEGDTGDPTDPGNVPAILADEGMINKMVDAINARTGGRGVSTRLLAAILRQMAEQEAKRSFRFGFDRGWRRRFGNRAEAEVFWHRTPEQQDFRMDVIRKFERLHGGNILKGRGYYYGTFGIPFDCTGTGTDGLFSLSVQSPDTPIVDTAFTEAIDQVDLAWFGGPHTLSVSDTNLQNPGQNLFPDEVFIIEAVQAYLRGVRINYSNSVSTIADPNLPIPVPASAQIAGMLDGTELLWDRAGRVLPIELFNQYNDTCELAQALAEVSTIWFNWVDRGIGGSKGTNQKLVGRFGRVPGVSRRQVRDTTGGGLTLDLPRGFIWTLDQQFQASNDTGGNGLFQAELHVDEPVAFPFAPVAPFGAAAPVLPNLAPYNGGQGGIALYWQICLWGTSLLPGKYGEDAWRRIALRQRM